VSISSNFFCYFAEISELVRTPNIVSKLMMFFRIYLNICGLRKGPGKHFLGVLESPGFFVGKRVGTLH